METKWIMSTPWEIRKQWVKGKGWLVSEETLRRMDTHRLLHRCVIFRRDGYYRSFVGESYKSPKKAFNAAYYRHKYEIGL